MFQKELLILGVLLISIFFSYNFDFGLYNFFNNFSNVLSGALLKDFFIKITELGDSKWYFFIFFAAFLFVFALEKLKVSVWEPLYEKTKQISIFTIICLLVTGLITQLIKHIIGRPRPNYTFFRENVEFEFFSFESIFHSFPSGHASTIFVIALVFSLFLPRIKLYFIFFAGLVAFSRIVVGAHFFTDVVAGIVVAYIGFKLSLIIFKKYFSSQFLEPIHSINNNKVYLVLIVFFIFSLFLSLGPSIDIYISNLFYLGKNDFVLQKHDVVTIFFRKIILYTIIAYLLVLPLLSKFLPIKFLFFKVTFSIKEIFFIFISLFVNLIIVVNLIFKNIWGRARPNDIVQLGGKESFTPWFEISDACQTNCSFFSGDSSVGFSLIIFFLLTNKKIFFWLSIIAGLVIGLIRILEGGHFFSDVILSGFFICFLSYLQCYFFKKKYLTNAN